MPTAEEIATRLAYDFLRLGRYSASTGPTEVPDLGAAAIAAADSSADEFAETAAAFSGLTVQAVGFEEGTKKPQVHIYLSRGSRQQVKSLPKTIDEVHVQLHKMGPINIRPDAAATATNRGNFYEHNGRVCCGSSCGPTSEACSGTFGAVARIGSGRQLFVLSNNHVLAGCNHVPLNQPVMSPSSGDGRPDISAPKEIARHSMISELRSGDPVFVNPCDADLAIARATDPDLISSWQGDNANGYDTPTTVLQPASSMRVKKFGRTTSLTMGEIEAKVTTPMPVAYTSKHFKGVVWFKDIWTVRAVGGQPFALPGDSGSLVVAHDGKGSIGLVFAANRSGEYAWIIPMQCVTNAFGGVKLVGRHGI